MMRNDCRRAGVILSISCLPGRYPIGDMGYEARRFIDWLKDAGCTQWSILPMNPTSYGNSPYQAVSAFAGNYYFIAPDLLIEEGLLEESDLCDKDFAKTGCVDYGAIFERRVNLLKTAFSRFVIYGREEQHEYRRFCEKHAQWLDNYGAFMVCKERNDYKPWWSWERHLAMRIEPEFSRYLRERQDEIEFWKFTQYIFYRQWSKLRKYANDRGIAVIGDMPFYVAADSADVWSHRELFEIDPESGRVTMWSGVPADAYTNQDRNWGNPVYRWEAHKADGYDWFRRRVRISGGMYDGLRIDHVIAVKRFFGIREGEKKGRWYDGPDMKNPLLSDAINEEAEAAGMFIIAEDLGIVPAGLREMMQQKGWPGMRILQYAFTGKYGARSNHLPFWHRPDMVVYTGTHDNCTLKEYLDRKSDEELAYLRWWTKRNTREELAQAMIEEAYKSPANQVIIPLQDILGLGEEARMVYTDDYERSWLWRLEDISMLSQETAGKMKALAVLTGRFPFEEKEFGKYLNLYQSLEGKCRKW